ncbi:MAG TPA: bifunctional hydroxymethylpyrimidine kinase/phosphomethylpyrimidine kinase [Pyrinomonadaceae bacterium]|nr:bifunctional hydroxymethylpyrimidine kinase/phosphomethylpyrimidine kinase [Pyrinomonadaceae bacterium]
MDIEQKLPGPVVMTIAGFDPSGGAGILADVKTLIAFGCLPAAAVTSVTFQNIHGVKGAAHQTALTVREQVMSIVAESQVAAVKTGMLPTPEIVREVARLFRETKLPAPVVDPVLRSTSGYQLMQPDAIEVLLTELMPLARVITPNIPEAERLTDLRVEDEEGMRKAAGKLREMGACAVFVKGGHLRQRSGVSGQGSERTGPIGQAIDVLDDEGCVTVFRGEWIDAPPVRGTGCMLSSAIAACLGKGMALEDAVATAKEFAAGAIRNSELRIQHSQFNTQN